MVRRFFGVWGILNGSALAFQRCETTVFSLFENNFQTFFNIASSSTNSVVDEIVQFRFHLVFLPF